MDTLRTKLYQRIKEYDTVTLVAVFSVIIYIIAGIYNDNFLEFMTLANYLTWHNLFEFASILISFSVFTVTYFIYEESGNFKMIMFGCVFLLMGSLDLFHTLSYKGMPDFFIANDTANRATTLWILSRLLGSLGFMSAISLPSRSISKIKKESLAGITIIFSIMLFLIVTYYPDLLPPMYIEEEGLASIKIFLEYLVIFILGISFYIVSRQYKKTNSDTEYQFMIALVLLIFSELAFTKYGSIYDAFNYIGHLYKAIAFSILYRSIYIANIRKPYIELKEAQHILKEYSDNLNVIVKERTKELENLNKILLNDIELAREMQLGLLPRDMPTSMPVSFNAVYLAAENLSGDFYNVVKLDNNNIAIYIGDVSGHGISASMLTVFAYQNIIQLKEKEALNEAIIEPGFVLKTLYRSFNKTNIKEDKYIVMIYGIYNIKTKTFNYSSAGFNMSPFIIKNSGEIHDIDVKGFPICKLGNLISSYYENRTLKLETGDKILFYSDGLTEAKDRNGERYGIARLKDFLKTRHNLNSAELNTAINEEFFKYIGQDSELIDDVTFLTMMVLS